MGLPQYHRDQTSSSTQTKSYEDMLVSYIKHSSMLNISFSIGLSHRLYLERSTCEELVCALPLRFLPLKGLFGWNIIIQLVILVSVVSRLHRC